MLRARASISQANLPPTSRAVSTVIDLTGITCCTHTGEWRHYRGVKAAWVLLGIAACRWDGQLAEGYQCGAGDRCPSGMMCVDGFCVSGSPDEDAGLDAEPIDAEPSPDADPSTVRCGGLANMRDDFEDPALDPHWWTFSDVGASTLESGGHLAVQLTAGTGSPYAGYTSAYRYDFTGSQIVAEVSQLGGEVTILEVRAYTGERAQLVGYGVSSELTAAVYNTADAGERVTIPYVAADHRYWRLREHLGDLLWEFSGDGDTWTELHSEPAPFAMEHVRGVVSAGEQVAAASEARFEVINPDAPAAGLCGVSTVVDAFGDTVMEPLWDHWEPTGTGACQLNETGGAVQMDWPGGVDSSWCGFTSQHLFALDAGGIYVDAMGVAGAPSFVSFLQVVDPWDDETRLEILRETTTISFRQRIDAVDVNVQDLTYDATAHRYWKIARSGTDAVFQTSPDASTWTTRYTTALMFDVDEVELVLGAGHYNDPGTAVTSYFRGINTP